MTTQHTQVRLLQSQSGAQVRIDLDTNTLGNTVYGGQPGLGMSFLHSALNGALIKAGGSAVVLDKGMSVVGAKSTRSSN